MKRWRHLASRPVAVAFLGVCVLAGILLDLFVAPAGDWFSNHQFVTSAATGAIELGLVYLGFDYVVAESESHRWREAAAEPLRLLVARAEDLDRELDKAIDADRKRLDRASDAYRKAATTFERFRSHLDRNQPLLTASPYMAGFLPVCLDLETYANYLLRPPGRGSPDDSLHIEWYERAVWNFIGKLMEVVPITEVSEPWLFRIPEDAYREQLRHATAEDREFLETYLRERGIRSPAPPPPLPGD
jgi:hypothetical protein